MSESMPHPEELSQQALKFLQSLREAGVEWLPRGEPVEFAFMDEPAPALKPDAQAKAPARKPDTQAKEESTPAPLVSDGVLFQPELAPGMDVEQRRLALQVLAEEVSGCTRCKELVSTRTQTVFADGPLDAELCFIGEAPGADEDAQGLPFVGAAGQLLNKIIQACGFKREEVYICNILKCRPPGNRTPLVNEAENCREFLEKQLELVQPKYICCLGSCAAQNLLGTTQSLGRLRRRFHDYNGIPVICTYHPAYLLPHRSPEKKRDVWEDMKMLLRRMGREIPTVKK